MLYPHHDPESQDKIDPRAMPLTDLLHIGCSLVVLLTGLIQFIWACHQGYMLAPGWGLALMALALVMLNHGSKTSLTVGDLFTFTAERRRKR